MISLKPEYMAAVLPFFSQWWDAQNIAMLCAIQSSGLWMLPGSRDVKLAGGDVLSMQMRPGSRRKSSVTQLVFTTTATRRAMTEAQQKALETGKNVVVQVSHADCAMFIAGLWWGVELEWSAKQNSWGIYVHPQGGDAIASRVGATKTFHKALVSLEVHRPVNPLWLQTTRAWELGVRKMGFANNVGIEEWLDATGHMTFTVCIEPVRQ
ncbi:hypothetical protein JKP88DRAFT_218590 [Tribonema minus]|uniref:Uncharacterized protein n=1 Tax=Tribonema minus TaxID=303371 RepID=A0A835Z529_9STRA|nr:hypothetical protein JKP88DRAFT_218590 [Tribonema minus]